MDLNSIKRSLENRKTAEQEDAVFESGVVDSLSHRFFEQFIMQGIKLEFVEPGRILCSLSVTARLVSDGGNSMHEGAIATLVDWVGASAVYTVGAATSGVSVEINVSYFDTAHVGDEIAIEAKVLHVGKTIAVITVELRNKKTGKLIAHGRHSMYMAVSSSKM